MLDVSPEEFDVLVDAALATVPEALAEQVQNLAVLVADEPPPDDPHLLGLYEGVPLTERGAWYGGMLPDRIMIYRNPILRMCSTPEEVVEEVRITVVHEIAHHFGIDDERLHQLGYG